MADIENIATEVVVHKANELSNALGADFNIATNRSTVANHEMMDSLLQILYLRGVIKASDVKLVLAGEDTLP